MVAATAVLLVAHGALQWVGALTFWRPCFDSGYDSDICMFLQYEAATPWWWNLSWLWPVEIALVIVALVLARRSHSRSWPALAALVLVAVCNIVTDYVLTPAFNGGYTSADAAPGHGMFGAVGIALAGCVLPVTLVPRNHKRARDESHARPAEDHTPVRF